MAAELPEHAALRRLRNYGLDAVRATARGLRKEADRTGANAPKIVPWDPRSRWATSNAAHLAIAATATELAVALLEREVATSG